VREASFTRSRVVNVHHSCLAIGFLFLFTSLLRDESISSSIKRVWLVELSTAVEARLSYLRPTGLVRPLHEFGSLLAHGAQAVIAPPVCRARWQQVRRRRQSAFYRAKIYTGFSHRLRRKGLDKRQAFGRGMLFSVLRMLGVFITRLFSFCWLPLDLSHV